MNTLFILFTTLAYFLSPFFLIIPHFFDLSILLLIFFAFYTPFNNNHFLVDDIISNGVFLLISNNRQYSGIPAATFVDFLIIPIYFSTLISRILFLLSNFQTFVKNELYFFMVANCSINNLNAFPNCLLFFCFQEN